MKTRIILFLFCLCTLSAAGQTIKREKCPVCGKLKVQCPGHEKKCPTCGQKFSTQAQLNAHKAKAHPAPTFNCNQCGQKFSTQAQLNAHKAKAHPNKPSINATITAPSGYVNGHGYVDLGLSVKWATCNVGASTPTEYGGYYAWGETRTKSDYSWSTYFDTNDGGSTFFKYALNKKTTLDFSDDAAHANWGGSWRMPTRAEQDELREKCSWTWTTLNGVKGYKVSSKRNSNSIFLPAAGARNGSSLYFAGSDGYCWSSSLDTSYSDLAYYLGFDSGNVDWHCDYRCSGKSVRAVCP